MQADLVTQFPNVSVIDLKEILQTIQEVVGKVTLAVTVDKVPPVRIPFANTAAQPQPHRGAFHVERLVVFEDAKRGADVEVLRLRVDLLEKQRQAH